MDRARVLLAAGGLALALAAPAGAGDRAIARVGGEAVTERDLAAAQARDPRLSPAEALRLLEERLLVVQWARKKGVAAVTEEEVDQAAESVRQGNRLSPQEFEQALRRQGVSLGAFRSELRETLLVNRATAAALSERIKVTDQEVAEGYHRGYPSRPTFTLRHVFFALPEGIPPQAREEKARLAAEVAARVRSGQVPFADAVARYSEDEATRGSGGDLGTFSPGELFPEMEKAAASLSPGGVSDPVTGPDGIHLIQLAGRGASEPPPLETVREELTNRLREEKAGAARRAWIEELSRDFLIEEFPPSR